MRTNQDRLLNASGFNFPFLNELKKTSISAKEGGSERGLALFRGDNSISWYAEDGWDGEETILHYRTPITEGQTPVPHLS